MNIHKNDTVLIISGKDRGRKGKVRRAFPEEEKVVVEGANMIKKHLRAQRGMRQAGIIEREAPLHVSKIMLICPKCNQPVRVGLCFLEDGRKARICRSCQEVID